MKIKALLIGLTMAGIQMLAKAEIKYPHSAYGFEVSTTSKDNFWLAHGRQDNTVGDEVNMASPGPPIAEIRSPFYITEFGIILIIGLIVIFISTTIYNYNRDRARRLAEINAVRIEERQIIRREIARDFHDEMGNHLARIINYVGLIRVKGQDINETLNRIESSAKDLIGETKDFVWALDPENESVFDLFVHVKDFGERLFSGSRIEFRTRFEIASVERLPLAHIRQINLILKELLTNVLKHSGAKTVELAFTWDERFIHITVSDDGIGINMETLNWNDGGLSNMAYRAKKINSKISLARNEVGTLASLEVVMK